MLAGSPGTGSYYYHYKFSNLGWNLVVLDGLVAAGMPPRQSRPFLVFYKYLPRYCALYVLCAALQEYQPVQIKCDLAQQAMTRTETWPKGHQEHHTRGYLCFAAFPYAIRGILRPLDWSCTLVILLPAQSLLLILKQCHCHQLALIRTWSTQFLEPTAEACNKMPPSSLTAWQQWQDRHLAPL